MTETPLATPADPVAALAAAFRHIAATRMAGVPILNPALAVEAVGFRQEPALDGRWLGVLITPWFMNLICLPLAGDDWHALPSGTGRNLDLPGGEVAFLAAQEDALGAYLSCSLFSPMQEFADQDYARAVAQEVLNQLLSPAAAEAAPAAVPPDGLQARMAQPVNRRGFLSALLPREQRR